MSIKQKFWSSLAILSFSSSVFSVNLTINEIALGEPIESAVEKLKKYQEGFDTNIFNIDNKTGNDQNNKLAFYGLYLSNFKDQSMPNRITVETLASDNSIWSVHRNETFFGNSGPLPDVLVNAFKEKYGEPTHSMDQNDHPTYQKITLMWVYDDKGNRVEGSHTTHKRQELGKPKTENDVCDYRHSIDAYGKVTQFNDNPQCGQLVFVKIEANEDRFVTNYSMSMTDYHKEYQRLVDEKNRIKLEEEKKLEEQKKKSSNYKASF